MSTPATAITANISLRQLFDELVELPSSERARRLEALDAETRAALSALLHGADAEIAMLNVPAADVLQRWREDNTLRAQLVGRRVGSFEVIEVLGEGGSSVVVRAQRAAGSAMQVVALKVLRTGIFTAEARWRFAREQAILTQLDHPNIARLIEGGISDEGLPYFAMELVDGEPITHYADRHALGLRERMALIATLCRAVEAAHSAMVVHRDLKPSNVLVTREGAVKVLDFGIAKSLDDDAPAHTTQAIMLTPEYAAPEQFRPGPVTSAADVYALGVLLGELLTGRLLGGTRTHRASTVLHDSPTRAPRGLPDATQLARHLRGDIDAMLATALAEEPSRRYRSAGAMADDLERYLANRPVHAHPPSRWYRARKFVRRHRGGVALTALLSLGMVTSLILALWQAGAARHAADHALVQAARADALRDIMLDAFTQAQPSTPGATDATVVDVAERAVATVRADRYADRRVRIDLLVRLAQVLAARGKLARSAALLAETEALMREEPNADDSLRADVEMAVIFNLVELGELQHARERVDRLLSTRPDLPPAVRVNALTESATIAARQSDFARGVRDAEAAVALADNLDDAKLSHDSRRTLGSVLMNANHVERAIPILEQALGMQRARFGDDHVLVAGANDVLSRAYRRIGNLDRAEQHARLAIAIAERVLPTDHAHNGLFLNALVMVLSERRAYDQMVAPLEKIIRIENPADADPTNLAANYGSLGNARAGMNDWAGATEAMRHALDILTQSGRENERLGLRLRMNLGFALAMSGAHSAGMSELDRVLTELRSFNPPEHELVAHVLERKIRIAIASHALDRVQPWLDEYATLARTLRERPMWPGRDNVVLAEVALARGQAAAAWLALVQVDEVLQGNTRVDPEVRAAVPLLRLLAAQRGAAPEAQLAQLLALAQAAYAALPYPPRHLQQLAHQAGLSPAESADARVN